MHGRALAGAPLPAARPAARRPTPRQPATCRAAGAPPPGATPRPRAPPPSDAEAARRQLAVFAELARDAGQLALRSGPAGVRRAAGAAAAALEVGREQAARLAAGRALDAPPAILRRLFERLGATYIKLGQFIASSPTLFPPEYVSEFQRCLDAAPPVPFSAIRRVAEAELGCALEDVFESVDAAPLATASVAQVHAAVLRGSRREVVLKVLKPGVEEVLQADLDFLYIAARFLEAAAPALSRASLAAVAEDVRASMLGEADFRLEAAHLGHFEAFLDAAGLRGLAACPELVPQFCSRRLLVMSRLRGAPLTDLAAVRRAAPGQNPELVLINALNVWFASVVGAESFHADVHAGNLLVLPDGRVGFIDFGIVGRLSAPTWGAVEALLRAVPGRDFATMARALATIGAAGDAVDLDAFAADLRALFDSLAAVDPALVVAAGAAGGAAAAALADDVAVNRFLLELVRVGEDNGVRFPREFALLLKQVLYFDRYTRLLAPGLQVFDDARVEVGGGGARGAGGGARGASSGGGDGGGGMVVDVDWRAA
jgi:aarF domain-containing kinase